MPNQISTVSIVGSGKVAKSLGKALKMSGVKLQEIWSRNPENASRLASELECNSVRIISDISPVDLVIVAISDDGIETVFKKIPENLNAVHTSGNSKLEIRAGLGKSGVFYPLQTFNSDDSVNWKNVPICIESQDYAFKDSLLALAKELSESVQEINSEQRKVIHVAAVMACNFTNHMAALSEFIMAENGMEIQILNPLLHQTFKNIVAGNIKSKQTGPAIRKDKSTIKSHLTILEDHPELKDLYLTITNHITSFHHG